MSEQALATVTSVRVRPAQAPDLPSIKVLMDAHRAELGFVPLPALQRALAQSWLHVAVAEDRVIGVVNWWARQDGVVVLYNLAVHAAARSQGVGRLLVDTLVRWAHEQGASEIRLKCPAELPSNAFYAHLGFCLVGQDPGKRRPLNCWSFQLGGEAQKVR